MLELRIARSSSCQMQAFYSTGSNHGLKGEIFREENNQGSKSVLHELVQKLEELKNIDQLNGLISVASTYCCNATDSQDSLACSETGSDDNNEAKIYFSKAEISLYSDMDFLIRVDPAETFRISRHLNPKLYNRV